jgi:hypothetical protein
MGVVRIIEQSGNWKGATESLTNRRRFVQQHVFDYSSLFFVASSRYCVKLIALTFLHAIRIMKIGDGVGRLFTSVMLPLSKAYNSWQHGAHAIIDKRIRSIVFL